MAKAKALMILGLCYFVTPKIPLSKLYPAASPFLSPHGKDTSTSSLMVTSS
jgi:hypothetical protein